MSQICQVCGKRPRTGKRVDRRGKAKYLGGVGRKITGSSKRWFRPNLQRVRAFQDGTVKRVRVCTQCIRSGKVVKPPARLKPGQEGPELLAAPPPPEPEVIDETVEEAAEDVEMEPEAEQAEGVRFEALGDEDESDRAEATE